MNIDKQDNKMLTRRGFLGGALKTTAGVAGGLILPATVAKPVFAAGHSGAHMVSFRNLHTGESFNGVYRVGDKYLPDSFDRINKVLRDFRTGEVFPMDPRIIDLLYAINREVDRNGFFEILSGYRSPKTNKMLQKATTGVAKNSLHMSGQAMDIRYPSFNSYKLRDIAQSMRAGGVGYYKGSNFVHVDTGQIRYW